MKALALLLVLNLPVAAMAAGPAASPRPPERAAPPTQTGLQNWLTGFRLRAAQAGISASTIKTALSGLSYNAEIIRRDRNQAEFTKTVWDYLDTAVSDLRIANGKRALARQQAALAEIEETYGVEKEIVTAIWGLESAYGGFRGNIRIIEALATLAYDARRAAFFEAELIEALRILDQGETRLAALRGSWAGAMGHTQFMPSSFQAHAVDFTGDGRRDIWGDDPRDALASTAAYLRFHGWTMGQPWGVEVSLPDGFDYTIAAREVTKLPSAWANLGIQPRGATSKDSWGQASILLPGGARGAAFMIFDNFAVLERYNTADAYVIGVGHLADRIAGAGAFASGWPRDLRALTKPERIELQERLTAAGFDTVKIDAKMGPLTVNAVRRFQIAQGLVPDGYPSLPLLERLRDL